MKTDFSAAPILWLAALTLASQVAGSTLDRGGRHLRRESCDSQLYRDILALSDRQNCTGELQVWMMLDHLYHQPNGSYCMKQVIMRLNERFSDRRHTPDYCKCSGSNTHHYPHISDHRFDCLHDQSYEYLYGIHFTRRHQEAHAYNCTSHHAVWHPLASIGSDTCRNDIVLNLAGMFQSSGDQCSCLHHSEGTAVQQTIHSTVHTTVSTKGPSDYCLQYDSYKYLYELGLHVDRCVSVNNMWHYLADLQHREVGCRRKIMEHMSVIFQGYQRSPNYCTCTGDDNRHDKIQFNNDHQTYCYQHHPTYKLLHDAIYAHSPSTCRSHQYLWHHLLHITIGNHEVDCRADLILRAAATFHGSGSDQCSCSHVAGATIFALNVTATSTHISLPSTTLAKPSTLRPSSPSTRFPSTATFTGSTNKATESLKGLHICNKASTISSIAYNRTVTHDNASDCATGDHMSSEALVLTNCNTNSTSTWIKGENVMELCNKIPLYTPIATFNGKPYQANGGKAGIFLGCLPHGFKIAVQECHTFTQIKHLLSGAFGVNNPSNYFIIRW